MRAKKIMVLLLAVCLSVSLFACGESSETGSGSAEGTEGEGGKTLTVGTPNDVTLAFVNYNSVNVNGCGLCYDRLTYEDPYTNERVSNILDDWYYEDDLHLVLKVKDGVTFTDGRELTGEDIVYSYTAEIANGGNNIAKLQNFDWDNVEISDDKMTVTIPTFVEYAPGIISLSDTWIECESYAEEHPTDEEIWWDTVEGTGPYYCVEQVDGAYSTYALRDNYWGSEEYEFDTVVIRHYSDLNAEFIDYENGTIDVALAIGEFNYNSASSGSVENTTVKMFGDGNPVLLCVNYDKVEAWNDERVRQAFAYALDLDSLGYAGFDGLYKVNNSFMPTTVEYYEDVGSYQQDIEKARELMEEAGYGDGFEITLLIAEKFSDLAEAIQAQLAQINVTVTLDVGEMMPQLKRQLAGEGDAVIAQTNTDNSGEPSDAFAKLVDNNDNILAMQVHDQAWNELLESSFTMDAEEREKLIKEIQQEFYDHVWHVTLVENTEAWCFNNTVLPEDFEAYVSGKSIFRVLKTEY